ncbi:penicillin-binding protein 1C [Candidatus Vecturithrix granuli]|uniref:peptidoglycan glycosyltransferase n=1 Tax=Vecturithrix granuli TaxID=1499967 RepID=A0A081BUT2_VECG1|nr:penicillin-binding protein 1C [Candidatus Vecturithrix granuli]
MWIVKKKYWLYFGLIGIALLFCVLGGIFWHISLPALLFDEPISTVILDREGKLLGASIAADEQWRFPPNMQIPDKLRKAVLCYEDKRFFLHPGVDPLAVLRAFWQNLCAGRVVSGASTLTMQVIRLARHGQPRTFKEKLFEAVLACKLEWTLSKQEILSLYLSYAPFGGNVVGVEAASWRYFGRSPEQLTWAESAMLAVLPNSPALIHPGRNRDALLQKRNGLLDRLQREGRLDALSCDLAKQETLPPAPYPIPLLAPHLLARVRAKSNVPTASIQELLQGRARIRTTLTKELQMRASEVLQRHQKTLAGNGIHNAAALIVEVQTGDVAVYIGNTGAFEQHEHGNQVDIIPAPRSTGSILKPFLFAAMLQAGELLPSQLIPDIPTRIGSFAPQNYSRSYQGAVTAYMALAQSLNVPAVRLLRSYSVDRFQAALKSFGMTTLSRPAQEYGLTLILGGAEASLWDLTGIYASMARCLNNYRSDHPDIAAFFPPHYLPAAANSPVTRQNPLNAPAIWFTFQAMLDVLRPDLEGAWELFSSSRRIAWKTGTSYGYRDAWAIGVTPRYAVGVWVGNADGEGRAGLTGLEAAAPILFDLYDLLDGYEWFTPPEADLVEIEVCSHSGYRAGPYCQQTRSIRAPRAGLQTRSCPYCQLIHTDAAQTWRVHSGCERIAAMHTISWFVLPPAMEWFYKQRQPGYLPLPPYRSDCLESGASAETSVMTLISPDQAAHVYVPLELSGQRGRIVFEVAHRQPPTTIYWHLDQEYLGETKDLHQMALAPAPGKHTLTLIDENGEFLERPFTVLSR